MNDTRVYTREEREHNTRLRQEKLHGHQPAGNAATRSTDGHSPPVFGIAWCDGNQPDNADHRECDSARPLTAADLLRSAAEVIEQRAALRDLPNGERSMLRAVTAYNALTGATMSELDGWTFMCVLKLARATAGTPHLDDFTDLAGYAALAGEGLA